jgi:cytochrome oxidase Cu insertion factor (SCO1/SenC/PrrC family)
VKIAVAILISLGLLAVASAQENRPSTGDSAPPIGLAIGQRSPEFSLVDQFGHEQSSATLKGTTGTVLLFFRSADW